MFIGRLISIESLMALSMVCAGRIEITLYDIELAIDLRQSTRRLEIDVVRKPIVWIVHKVELDGIPLPNTNKFAEHQAAKRPERVCDTSAIGRMTSLISS